MNFYENINCQLNNYDYNSHNCSSCKREISSCNCNVSQVTLYSCDLCLQNEECIDKIDTRCVVYNLNEPHRYSGLQCLNILSNSSLHTILETFANSICNTIDQKVKVSITDTTLGFLFNKIVVGNCLTKTIINQNGNEQLHIGINHDCLCNFISNCNIVTLTLLLLLVLTLSLLLLLVLILTLTNSCISLLSCIIN